MLFWCRQYGIYTWSFWKKYIKVNVCKSIPKTYHNVLWCKYGICTKIQRMNRVCLLKFAVCVNQKTITFKFNKNNQIILKKWSMAKAFYVWCKFCFYVFFLLKAGNWSHSWWKYVHKVASSAPIILGSKLALYCNKTGMFFKKDWWL